MPWCILLYLQWNKKGSKVEDQDVRNFEPCVFIFPNYIFSTLPLPTTLLVMF
jgi:hypothetical protein